MVLLQTLLLLLKSVAKSLPKIVPLKLVQDLSQLFLFIDIFFIDQLWLLVSENIETNVSVTMECNQQISSNHM